MAGTGSALPGAGEARDASIRLAYLAAELERAAHEHRLAAADLDAIRLALVGGLISADQALGHVEAADHFRFFGPLPEDRFWGPEWAESARQYHEERKRSAKATPVKVPR